MEAVLPGGILSMTGEAVDRLLRQDSGDAALLYLHLLRGSQAPALPWPEERRRAAFEQLLALGLAQESQLPPYPAPKAEADVPPDYSGEDIARELSRDAVLAGLAGEMERRLGKLLSPADLKSLYTLYDYLGLPAEVILMLTTWCVQQARERYGLDRPPRMAQIRQEAFRWHRLGIRTVQGAEEHLKRLGALRGRERELLPLLGLEGRPLVERERSYLAAWIDQGFDNGALQLAYEKTVMKKGGLNWSYMNGILRRWHEKGLHTAQAVAASDSDYPRRGAGESGRQQAPGALHSPPPDQVRSDMERMRRLMERMKEGEG